MRTNLVYPLVRDRFPKFKLQTVMESQGNSEGRVIRVPQLRRGKDDVPLSERVSCPTTIISVAAETSNLTEE